MDLVHQRSKLRTANGYNISVLMGEAEPFRVAVLCGGEKRSGKKGKTVRVLVVPAVRSSYEFLEGTADPAKAVPALKTVTVHPFHSQGYLFGAKGLQRESAMEQPDERANRARGIVVLGHSQQEGTSPFHVPEIHIIAERSALDPACGIDHEDEFRFGIVPRRKRGNTNAGTVTHG